MKLKILLFTLAFAYLPVVSWADTVTASSCSRADVLSAYNTADAGDTVSIPAGKCTWTTPDFTIDKAITLEGASNFSTVITGGPAFGTPATIILVQLSSDVYVRITGIYFKYATNNTGARAIHIKAQSIGFPLTQLRIDHNKFEKGTRIVFADGRVEGVIDNNTFINCNICIGIRGDNDDSWDRAIEAGTANALFIEDNTFTITNDSDRLPNQLLYHQEGARTVTRYNTFDGTAYTDNDSLFYDSHGNQKYYPNSTLRGQPIVEIYNNTMAGHHSYRMVDFRGGSVLFYNNTMTTTTGKAPFVDVTDEEAWKTQFFTPLDTSWPAEDQVNNSFFWNNTSNGNPLTVKRRFASDEIFIKEGRDYFMHAPKSSGGYEYYTGRKGAAGNGNDGTLVWSSSGANAYYPYKQYTYPHPLTTTLGTETKPMPPKNLFVLE